MQGFHTFKIHVAHTTLRQQKRHYKIIKHLPVYKIRFPADNCIKIENNLRNIFNW